MNKNVGADETNSPRTPFARHEARFRATTSLIAFGRHAEVMDIEQLTGLDAQYGKGTNLHHALLLANRHFRKHPNAQPVLSRHRR
jgi:uncharacterized protein with von Willebrand factor type A (vWA) domain